MKATDIVDVYRSRFKKLSNYYEKVLEDFEVKDIHRFRVEMKKLRAFIRLMNVAIPDHPHKVPKEIKKFYNVAGNMRNLQLHQKRIAGLANDLLIDSPLLYSQHLQEEEKFMKKNARELGVKVYLKEFEEQLIHSATYDLPKEMKAAYVQKQRIGIEALVTLPDYYDEALHDIRKLLKDLMYNYKYLGSAIDILIPPLLANFKRMEAMTTTLGEFHDLCIALFLLSPLYMQHLHQANETQLLNELRIQLHLRKEAMKDKIIGALAALKQQIEREKSLVQANDLF